MVRTISELKQEILDLANKLIQYDGIYLTDVSNTIYENSNYIDIVVRLKADKTIDNIEKINSKNQLFLKGDIE